MFIQLEESLLRPAKKQVIPFPTLAPTNPNLIYATAERTNERTDQPVGQLRSSFRRLQCYCNRSVQFLLHSRTIPISVLIELIFDISIWITWQYLLFCFSLFHAKECFSEASE